MKMDEIIHGDNMSSSGSNDAGKANGQAGLVAITSRFAILNKLITRDLNNRITSPVFKLFTKDDITEFLTNPYKYEKQLRQAVVYLYGASPHFRRLIQYFTSLSDLSYIVSPHRIDPKSANQKSVLRNYRRVLNVLSSMSIKTQFPKIITVCLREDTFYGTIWMTQDNITIQQLPSEYCQISSIEGNVLNVTFNFQYFDARQSLLPYYPEEFTIKYKHYTKHRDTPWMELDAPTSFAIKCNTDILDYAIPPFAGILREVYDIEDYKQLRLTKEQIENYALLAMKIPMDEDGRWLIDFDKAKDFWRNLDAVMPDEVGSVLTPMDIDKISFEKSNTGDVDTVADAEQNLFTAAGVSSLLFNNEKASANALLLSIKADQALTFGIVKSIEDMVNRFIQAQNYGKYFKVTFLDVSPFNRKEAGDAYLKAATYGLPTISMYAASQGLGQSELDCMSYLEGEVLELHKLFKPLQSSTQMSAQDKTSDDNDPDKNENGGAPVKEVGELTDSGEQSREDGSDWG